jgi:Fur family transcriptional regulator, iron response regulator
MNSRTFLHRSQGGQQPHGGNHQNELSARLREAGLRPTRQRMALASFLFASGDRHVTAETLHLEAVAAGERISLATVYNTLHQLRGAGLLRELAVDGSRTYFDTNTSNHNHYFIESAGELIDIPSSSIRVDGLPEPPTGMKIAHIDVVVRLVKA